MKKELKGSPKKKELKTKKRQERLKKEKLKKELVPTLRKKGAYNLGRWYLMIIGGVVLGVVIILNAV